RQITTTYIEKLEDSDITRVYSPGYTAPEQLQGQAVFRSDFFALGRTFIHLMTGIYPNDLPKTQTNQLFWHNLAPQISNYLQDLIDRTIALSPLDRPHAGAILDRLNGVSEQPTAVWHNRPPRSWQREAILILNSSMAIAFLVIGMRYLGWLQPMELMAFDRLMQLRPLESPDSRIVLITVDEADIQYQDRQNMSLRWSLADEALAQLLVKIKPYQPRTIGIDIYRDFAVESDYPNLAQELQTSDRLYAVCKVAAPQDGNSEGTPPPPEVPLSRLGFSDFVADSGDVIRRQLIHLNPPTTSSCKTEYAFSLQLALDYLHRNGIESRITPAGDLQIGTSTFKPITQHSGGYQGIDAAGYQILLNYRSLKSVQNIAPQISLRDILSDRYSAQLQNLIKDRLIIIGVIASSSSDDWQTPYSRQSSLVQKQIAGVYIQAQMIGQIISTAIDHRPLIWWWSDFWSTIWIGGWGLLGGILGWYLRRPLLLGSAIAGAVFGQDAARGEILKQMNGLVGIQGAQVIETALANADQPQLGSIASIISVIILLIGASGVFAQLQEALNTVWNVKAKPEKQGIWEFIRKRILSFGMVLAIGFLLLVSLILSAMLSGISNLDINLLPGFDPLWEIVNFVISFGFVSLLFALIYKYLPDVKIRWKDVWVGAIITALLFTIGKYLIGLYLGQGSLGSTYGAAGSLIIFLAWVFYSAQILLFGAEFTQVYARKYGRKIVPNSHAELTKSISSAPFVKIISEGSH
ncbi:MAG: hypothetical protein RLZZ69_3894, partial [Cyanobacteriota bacterium]